MSSRPTQILLCGALFAFSVQGCFDFGNEDSGTGGASSSGGDFGGGSSAAGGVGGTSSDGAADADLCGPLMILSGSVCVDRQPALHADGSQGPAVSFTAAVTICEARGARLCTEAEREGACPGGQTSSNGLNATFCGGPANTWEWSSSASCVDGRCVSPCCNSVLYPCQCSQPATDLRSYRCCRSV